MSSATFRLHHESQDELERKLVAVMQRLGYRVEKPPEEITMRQLAARVGRSVASISRAIRRPTCPPFESVRGKRRILRLTPTPRLIAFLEL